MSEIRPENANRPAVGIFVDGVGRRQRRVFSRLPAEYRFPRRAALSFVVDDEPPAFVRDEDYRFRLLWQRGRVGVYGFVFETGPQFSVWGMDAAWSYRLESKEIVRVLNEQDVAVERFLSRSGALGPALTLLEFISADPVTMAPRRQIIGIARTRRA